MTDIRTVDEELVERLRHMADNHHAIKDCDAMTKAATRLSQLLQERDYLKEQLVEVSFRAHNWMRAHDLLKAGKPYDYPTPADAPKALQERDEARNRVAVAISVIENGYPGQPAKTEQCKHERFGFEDCIACYDEALLAALTGEHNG